MSLIFEVLVVLVQSANEAAAANLRCVPKHDRHFHSADVRLGLQFCCT